MCWAVEVAIVAPCVVLLLAPSRMLASRKSSWWEPANVKHLPKWIMKQKFSLLKMFVLFSSPERCNALHFWAIGRAWNLDLGAKHLLWSGGGRLSCLPSSFVFKGRPSFQNLHKVIWWFCVCVWLNGCDGECAGSSVRAESVPKESLEQQQQNS